MDLYASAALTELGYSLSKQRNTLRDNERRTAVPDPGDKPSMNNAYSSTHQNNVWETEWDAGNSMWMASQNPTSTGVVPRPAYADMFAAPTSQAGEGFQGRPVQSLSGELIPPERFTHENMEPYFSGTIRQNTDVSRSVYGSKLESFTGTGIYKPNKKEVACFFETTSGVGNPCGFVQNNNAFYLNRIQAPKAQNNTFPIEQIHVGPGLGNGYTSTPEGGFQQSSTLDYVKPKSVDELRIASDERRNMNKFTMQESRVGTFQRAVVAPMDKNRPDTFYEQCSDQWLKTTGAVIKEMNRPEQEMKPTSRVDSHIDYKGSAQDTIAGRGAEDTYGKESVMTFNNTRDITGTQTVLNNLTSAVKAIISPLLDIFRDTPKEYTLDAAREFGNMHAQIPEKPTTYDPVNHIMRTTIKETTVHDTTIANLKGNTAGPVTSDDEARTTNRQTLPVEDVIRNVSSHKYNVTVYNVDEVARTTVRETTKETGSMYGFIGGKPQDSPGAYSVIDVDMKNTQKQFISDYEYEGIAGSKTEFRETSKEADYNADIDGTREAMNIAAGYTPNGAGGFTGQDPATIDMESKRLLVDSIATRETANASPKQSTARAIENCEVTRKNDFLNGGEERLDGNILSSLRSNPYSININPVSMS
jgi:hypothetical protein